MTDFKIPFCRLYERRSKTNRLDLPFRQARRSTRPLLSRRGRPGKAICLALMVAGRCMSRPRTRTTGKRVDRPQRPALAAVATARWRDK